MYVCLFGPSHQSLCFFSTSVRVFGGRFTHSCAPNCGWNFSSAGELIYFAIRPVGAGDLLTFSYIGDGFNLLSGTVSRRLGFPFLCCHSAYGNLRRPPETHPYRFTLIALFYSVQTNESPSGPSPEKRRVKPFQNVTKKTGFCGLSLINRLPTRKGRRRREKKRIKNKGESRMKEKKRERKRKR